jgi:hypothetical protein
MKRVSLIALLCLWFVLVACDTSEGGGSAVANPTDFFATTLSSTEIQLEWTSVAGATGYTLEKQNGSTFTNLATLDADATTYTDENLTPATSYTYRIKALNGMDASAGLEVTARTRDEAGSGFSVTVDPATFTLTPGGNSSVTITLQRTGGFTEAVTLSLEGNVVGATPEQIAGTFAPNPSSAGSSSLTLTVGTNVPAGDYTLTVRGVAGSQNKTATLNVKINAAKTILLVDDDRSANNEDTNATPSESDKIFTKVLNDLGKGYDTFVVLPDTDGPSFDEMKNYQTVIWYTGDQFDSRGGSNTKTVSSADEISLKAFLDQDARRLLLFSSAYIYGLFDTASWTGTTNTFLKDYIGVVGAKSDVLNDQAFTAKGVSDPSTVGLSLQIADNTPIRTYTSAINVGSIQDFNPLFTALSNPDGNGVRDTAIATGRLKAGAAGTSAAVLVAFSYENIVDVGANSKQAVMQSLLEFSTVVRQE